MNIEGAQKAWPELHLNRWIADRLGSVRDQGVRGTCLAFATTVAHEHRIGGGEVLSPEYLFWAAKLRDGKPSDDGTTVGAILAALQEDGQPCEDAWPYDPARPWPWPGYAPPDPECSRFACSSSRAIPAVTPVLVALDQGRAPVLAVEVTENLIIAAGGRILAPEQPLPALAQHALAAVGYGTVEGDQIVVAVRNSWGDQWGVQGHALVPARYLEHHLRAVAVLDE